MSSSVPRRRPSRARTNEGQTRPQTHAHSRSATAPGPVERKWSIDDAHASRLYSPSSPALHGVMMLGSTSAHGHSSSTTSAYHYSSPNALNPYNGGEDGDIHRTAPVASSSKLLLEERDRLNRKGDAFHTQPQRDVRGHVILSPTRRRACEWDFAFALEGDDEHFRSQGQHQGVGRGGFDEDWSPLSDLSLASTSGTEGTSRSAPYWIPQDVSDSIGLGSGGNGETEIREVREEVEAAGIGRTGSATSGSGEVRRGTGKGDIYSRSELGRNSTRGRTRAAYALTGMSRTARLETGWEEAEADVRDRKSTRLNSSHSGESRMPSSA